MAFLRLFRGVLQFATGGESHGWGSFVEVDTHGVAPLGDQFHLLAQELAQQGDAAIAFDEMLLGMERDGALAGLGLEVARKPLMLFRRELLPQLAALARAHAAQVTFLADAPRDVDAKMRVVDRQGPADRFDTADQARPGNAGAR